MEGIIPLVYSFQKVQPHPFWIRKAKLQLVNSCTEKHFGIYSDAVNEAFIFVIINYLHVAQMAHFLRREFWQESCCFESVRFCPPFRELRKILCHLSIRIDLKCWIFGNLGSSRKAGEDSCTVRYM